MTIKVRLSGEPDEITRLVTHLRDHFEVAGSDRAYPNRGSFGVRVFLELREAHQADSEQKHRPADERLRQRVHSERIYPPTREVEP
ncbi:hypothetical protein E0H75_07230 [Kribbella capetownensis]|uniref:Uncharacterized protein n=1 Tax=Kribbella capetownensis TaxID=1572659 RepID=A0A4R0K671_9ACTN|nr:hypothetical protein [Kribbella capetownensis]TCC53476.1 hypothetical protein E0H75_07230 [Kribbella capetownensis]